MPQGKRILILHLCEPGQDLEQLVLLPTRQEAFAFNAPFANFLLLEYFQGDMSQQGKVFRPVIFPHPAMIGRSLPAFIKGQVQRPMQLVLDSPMRAHAPQDAFCSNDTGDMIAVFATLFCTQPALGTDPRHGQQLFPVGKAAQVRQNFGV